VPAVLATSRTTYVKGDPAGVYANSCSGAQDPNYTFVYANGTQVVTRGEPRIAFRLAPTVVRTGRNLAVTVALTYGSVGGGSGRQVAASIGSGKHIASCRGKTSSTGLATCTIRLVTASKGTTVLIASFAGDPKGAHYDYGPASVHKKVTVT
jgi:hypothetical protein